MKICTSHGFGLQIWRQAQNHQKSPPKSQKKYRNKVYTLGIRLWPYFRCGFFGLFAFRAAENFINIQIVSLIEIYC